MEGVYIRIIILDVRLFKHYIQIFIFCLSFFVPSYIPSIHPSLFSPSLPPSPPFVSPLLLLLPSLLTFFHQLICFPSAFVCIWWPFNACLMFFCCWLVGLLAWLVCLFVNMRNIRTFPPLSSNYHSASSIAGNEQFALKNMTKQYAWYHVYGFMGMCRPSQMSDEVFHFFCLSLGSRAERPFQNLSVSDHPSPVLVLLGYVT